MHHSCAAAQRRPRDTFNTNDEFVNHLVQMGALALEKHGEVMDTGEYHLSWTATTDGKRMVATHTKRTASEARAAACKQIADWWGLSDGHDLGTQEDVSVRALMHQMQCMANNIEKLTTNAQRNEAKIDYVIQIVNGLHCVD